MKKRYNDRNRHKTAHSEIRRLEEAVRRASDEVEREDIKQHLEHWIRTQNNSK